MADCNHWIPLLREQEKAEHKAAEDEYRRKVYAIQDARAAIISILNSLDRDLKGGQARRYIRDGLLDSLRAQQELGALQSLAQGQDCRNSIFGGLFS